MTARDVLQALKEGLPLVGRHVIVAAHPDDETVSCAAVLTRARDVRLVHLTGDHPRRMERTQAFAAAGWYWPILDGDALDGAACQSLTTLSRLVAEALADADVVWTHPYEGGHLDHDTAAYLVQQACAGRPMIRMEFASYYSRGEKRDVYGRFVPHRGAPEVTVALRPKTLVRKRAALAAYVSQAHILKKFPIGSETYRIAPVYDFTQPAPGVESLWDRKGYQPTSSTWRGKVAACIS